MESPRLEYTAELLRHFADLRDGTHGGAVRRQDKERFFTAAITLLDVPTPLPSRTFRSMRLASGAMPT